MFKYQFTVFTPTYNRASTIGRVYQSLCAQSCKDFEWLIIDDGSVDNTKDLIASFIEESKVPIRYYKQQNTHKFFTILKAAELADGEFFYSVDSDDEIFVHALEILLKTWLTIPEGERNDFSGVTGLCVDQNMRFVGTKYPRDVFDSNTLESIVKYKIKGEKSGFQRTELLRKFQFGDDFKNNGYILEGILWIGLANQGYKTRYINQVIRKYYVNAGESIMTSSKFRPSAFGTYQFTHVFLNSFKWYYFYNLRLVVGLIRNYTVAGWLLNFNSLELFLGLKYMAIKILYILTLPISLFYSLNVDRK